MLNESYKQIKQLGKGKFSSTFLVEDEKGEYFVIKRLKELHSHVELDTDLDIQNLQSTLKQNANLILKDYLDGTPLNTGDFSKVERLQACLEILVILEELHSRGIIHADLKPSNILIGKQTYLLDLGLAVDLNNLKKRKTRYAMVYAAPELVLNRLDLVSPSTDLYALAAIVSEIVSGTPIHQGDNPSVLINQMLAHPVSLNKRASGELNEVLKNLLQKPAFHVPPNRLSREQVESILKKTIQERTITHSQFRHALAVEIQRLNKSWLKRLFA